MPQPNYKAINVPVHMHKIIKTNAAENGVTIIKYLNQLLSLEESMKGNRPVSKFAEAMIATAGGVNPNK